MEEVVLEPAQLDMKGIGQQESFKQGNALKSVRLIDIF